jgi:virulence-associated protein VapD
MVNNTSAFHLEEKASALPVPGITVSNNKKQMLRDAKKKYAEYAAERQKYDCKTPIEARTKVVDKMSVSDNTVFSSDSCAFIDKKIMKLDRFTTMVNNTSAFHLEEKASALPVPGITVSNNKKQMLRDAKKKYAEYAAERQKYDCKTPIEAHTQVVNKKAVVSRSANIDKKIIKTDDLVHRVNNASVANVEVKVKHKKEVAEIPVITQRANKKRVVSKPIISSDTSADKVTVVDYTIFSSDSCAAISKKIIRLNQFTTMVNNTSAFHLEEKAAALSVPGITVSNNKKKMLKIAKKKGIKLLKEYQKYGCETSKK